MSKPTDDELGARLRSVLQDITPLASDPVPTARFATDGDPPDGHPAFDIDDSAGVARRSRRRFAVVTGSLLAAAVALGVTFLLTGVPGHSATPAASPHPSPTASVTALGATPWRCTAATGALLQITGVMGTTADGHESVYLPGDGVTCVPITVAQSAFVVTDGKVGVRDPSLGWGKDEYNCRYAETRRLSPLHDPSAIVAASAAAGIEHALAYAEFSFTSRGDVDYVDFYGPDCRIVLPNR